MHHAAGLPKMPGRASNPFPFRLCLCFLIILVLAAPVSAVVHTLNPGDSIQQNITDAAAGDTIILNPGTYSQHNITISKEIAIRANTSYGGTAANTIIDAQMAGTIFYDNDVYPLTIDNLTLQNGKGPEIGRPGGAIYANGILTITSSAFINCTSPFAGAIWYGGPRLTITDSVFTNCSASANGGAILNDGPLTISGSTFSNCSAGGNGGAITNDGPLLTITSSIFTGCSAERGGGAIFNYFHPFTITNSTFSGCSALGSYGGAINNFAGPSSSITTTTFSGCSASGGDGYGNGGAVYNDMGTLTITSSTFSGCSASGGTGYGNGGAVVNEDGTLTITSSTFSGCSASGPAGYGNGGAVFNNAGPLTITSSTFTGCTATGSSGAIHNNEGTVTITGAAFTGCRASSYGGAFSAGDYSKDTITNTSFSGCTATTGGGAIAVSGSHSTLSVLSSNFEDCTAGSDGGGAVLSFPATTLYFSRFHGNTASGSGTAVRFVSPSSDATSNWWGTNSAPGAAYAGNPAAVASWLVLGGTADPSSITTAGTSTIRANLTYNSSGTDTAAGGIFVPAKILSTFAVVTGGTVSPLTAGTANGVAQTVFTPAGTGTANISATVDDQTVYLPVLVSPAPVPVTPVVTPDTSNSDDGFPTPVISPTTTGAGAIPPMTVTVNIGGDSGAWRTTVTGSNLAGLIVTGTVQPGPGTSITVPPGTVYQYISLVPARYTSITKAVINFTVPQSWLDEKHIDPKSIVLYHQTTNGWVALPTTVLYTKDGTVYFSAVSPGLSLFAIAGTPSAATQVTTVNTPAVTSSPVQENTLLLSATTEVPVTTQTTAAPAAAAPPSAPSPLTDIFLVIAAVGVLGAGGFLVRRWYTRRQNPALFTDYE